MQGLLAAFMNPPADDEDGFNAWYDEEHVPLRVATPGFLSGRRFKAAGPQDFPRYLALYELESLDVLKTAAYTRLNGERSEREANMMARIPMIDRRELELVVDCAPQPDEAAYQMTVCMSPPAQGFADFADWYRQEHIGMLLEVPGWRRVRLFRQVVGDGPSFMAVHELDTPDVFDHPNYTAAISTPWRARIRSSVSRYERSLFRLLGAWPRK
jgi:hypothetical protein